MGSAKPGLYALVLIAGLAPAQAQPSSAIACTGPFARDSSHAKVVAAFGEANVAFMKVDGPESSEVDATVIFADDPARRIEITWKDAARTRLDVITFGTPAAWVAPSGVRVGMTLAEIVKLNGAPFRINGFGWDNEGLAELRGGKFARLPGGCMLTVRFQAAQNPLGPRFERITGNRRVASDHPLMREAAPKVVEIFLDYK